MPIVGEAHNDHLAADEMERLGLVGVLTRLGVHPGRLENDHAVQVVAGRSMEAVPRWTPGIPRHLSEHRDVLVIEGCHGVYGIERLRERRGIFREAGHGYEPSRWVSG